MVLMTLTLVVQLNEEGGPMLKNVCNAPMVNDFTGPRVVEQCLVQSLFGYFGNSWEQLYAVDDGPGGLEINYLDKLLTCIQ